MQRFMRFVVAGTIGFAIDAGMLWLLLVMTPLDPFSARLLAIATALGVTWQLNRHITFGPSDRHVVKEGARYGGVGLASAGLNYAIYSALLAFGPAMTPLLALALASGTVMLLSFAGYSRLVFDTKR